MKMAENSSKGWKTLWEKEKLLAASNFSFSHSVFERFVLQTHKKGLVWERVKDKSNYFIHVQCDFFKLVKPNILSF